MAHTSIKIVNKEKTKRKRREGGTEPLLILMVGILCKRVAFSFRFAVFLSFVCLLDKEE